MQPTDKEFSLKDTARLLFHLRQSEEQGEASATELPPQMALLRSWQSRRLAQTYADLRDNPRYSALYRFFLEDIYAPKDFSRRNLDGERLYRFLRRFFSPQALRAMTLTLELSALTEELDNALLEALVNQLDFSNTLTETMYAKAYRLCDNYAKREKQIELIVAVARRVNRFARMSFVAPSLRLARGPAKQAGLSELHGFFERGLLALKNTRDVDPFLQIVEERERRILKKIFAGEPEPLTPF
ncbi:MAG TPA: hypothetical protein G4N96_03275 [Chloroflexi bacterium]|nr:hypothetical protein [Chloroflexota bacterium]